MKNEQKLLFFLLYIYMYCLVFFYIFFFSFFFLKHYIFIITWCFHFVVVIVFHNVNTSKIFLFKFFVYISKHDDDGMTLANRLCIYI